MDSEQGLYISLGEYTAVRAHPTNAPQLSFMVVPEFRSRKACLQLLPGLLYSLSFRAGAQKAHASPSAVLDVELDLTQKMAKLACRTPTLIFDGMPLVSCKAT